MAVVEFSIFMVTCIILIIYSNILQACGSLGMNGVSAVKLVEKESDRDPETVMVSIVRATGNRTRNVTSRNAVSFFKLAKCIKNL